ncbi:MAG: hypothetical protein ACKO3K_01745 [Cuspidothrix sp.]
MRFLSPIWEQRERVAPPLERPEALPSAFLLKSPSKIEACTGVAKELTGGQDS